MKKLLFRRIFDLEDKVMELEVRNKAIEGELIRIVGDVNERAREYMDNLISEIKNNKD